MSDTHEQRASANLRSRCPVRRLPYVLAIAILIVGRLRTIQVVAGAAVRGVAGRGDHASTAVGPPLTDFELTERSGKPFRSADMKGKVWVATYFFTTCPGSCIRLNQNIKFMHNLPELKDVTWVSITCDPDNDTVEALAEYARPLESRPGALAVLPGRPRLHQTRCDWA